MDHLVVTDVDAGVIDPSVFLKDDDVPDPAIGSRDFVADAIPLLAGAPRDRDTHSPVNVLGQAGTVKPAFFPGFSTENVGRTQKLSAS